MNVELNIRLEDGDIVRPWESVVFRTVNGNEYVGKVVNIHEAVFEFMPDGKDPEQIFYYKNIVWMRKG